MNAVQLLVSVRNDTEAQVALRGGADIIDAKEPNNGALGACDEPTIAAIADAVQQSRPLSVACGELLSVNIHDAKVSASGVSGDHRPPSIQYRKYGLAGAADIDWQTKAKALASNRHVGELVIVAYADFSRVNAPDPREVMAWASQRQNVNLLIDTAVKDGTCLFDWMNEQVLAELIASANVNNTMIGLAGSLKGDAFRRAARLRPHIIGVRGAVCDNGHRSSSVSRSLVQQLAGEIASINATRNTPAVTQSHHVEG